MGQKRFLVFIMAGLLVKALTGQTYNFRNYSEDDGLPQSYIYKISQSPNGFLNLSTGEGYSSFDGSKFVTFTEQQGLAENFITTHFTDSRKVVWLGHFQNGISYLYNKSFHKLIAKELLSVKISQFAEAPRHQVLIATQGAGIWMADSLFHLSKITPDMAVNAMCFDASKHLLYASTNGLYMSDMVNGQLKNTSAIDAFSDKIVKSVIAANRENTMFWVSVDGEGVYGIKQSGNTYTVWAHILSRLNSANNNVSCIYSDHAQNLWVGLFGEGIRKLTFSEHGINDGDYVVSKIDKNNGLKNEYIQSIFEDFEGNMWFGTFGGGLIEKPIEKFSFYGEREGIVPPDIKAVITDDEGHLWLGNDNGLIDFDVDHMSSVLYTAGNGFVKDQVSALMEEGTSIWIGTKNNGVFIMDAGTHAFTDFSKTQHLAKVSVSSICRNRKGIIFIGTDNGIIIYNPVTKTVKQVTTVEGLLHNNVIQLYNDSHDRLWISSHGAPPYYLQGDDFTVYKDIPGMKLFNINAVCEDNDNNIWIATEGDGVYKFDGLNFNNYKTASGMLSNYCYGVRADRNNAVWVTHKTGYSEKKPAHKEFQNYTSHEGLLFVENNVNALSKDRHGDLWLGTTLGIVHFNAGTEKNYSAEPKLSILDVILDHHMYTPDQTIEKGYGNYSLQVDYAGVSLSDPAKLKYKYRLLGLDSAWRTTAARFIEYSNLGDGDYVFQVMACNHEGTWTSVPAEISISIKKPIWKHIWFYLLVGGLLIAGTYLIIYLRIKQLKKTEAFLQLKIKQKTYLLQREKETVEHIKVELENKNKDITDSINYASRIQEALLPSRKSISENFADSFIYYQPRDIVSGDFYWFSETEDHYIVAAVDCTGHGVPGAFMSLIGSTLLNEIVNNSGMTVPSLILKELNDRIIKILNQFDSEHPSYDGMDMALCAINKEKTMCVYAGAYRPLCLVHNGEFTELKGNRYSVGGHNTGAEKLFTDHVMNLHPGDMLYMFSDGYADQFNGLHKKFTTKRLKVMLGGIAEHGTEKQLEIVSRTFTDWKGPEEQVDDILVIGIKI